MQRDPGSAGSAGERVVYMTDSSNFKYVVHEIGDPFKGSSTHNGNRPWVDNLQRYMVDQLGQPTRETLRTIHAKEGEWLQKQGVFRYPAKESRDELIGVFFDYSYPSCPIFHAADFMALYDAGRLSPLVLNAVLFMAALHCSESLLGALGFASRYLAALTFYRRAKALYDAGYESDGIATVQAVILLSHWIDGPMEQKDAWHWLGIAAGLAQSLGMNRTLAS